MGNGTGTEQPLGGEVVALARQEPVSIPEVPTPTTPPHEPGLPAAGAILVSPEAGTGVRDNGYGIPYVQTRYEPESRFARARARIAKGSAGFARGLLVAGIFAGLIGLLLYVLYSYD
jgi:hypothetical protein